MRAGVPSGQDCIVGVVVVTAPAGPAEESQGIAAAGGGHDILQCPLAAGINCRE